MIVTHKPPSAPGYHMLFCIQIVITRIVIMNYESAQISYVPPGSGLWRFEALQKQGLRYRLTKVGERAPGHSTSETFR